jgi:putative ABC transport system permease protein
MELGFDPRNLYVAAAAFPPGRPESTAARQRFFDEARNRLRTVRGAASVALSTVVPPFGGPRTELQVPGMPIEQQPSTLVHFCDEEYPATIGLTLVAGRHISGRDISEARKVVVVNEALVRKYFAESAPLGRTVRLDRLAKMPKPVADPTYEIVGVVRDVANQGIRDPAAPHAYLPLIVEGQMPWFVIRTSTDPDTIAGGVREAVRAIDPEVALPVSTSLPVRVQQVFYAQPRFSVIVLGMFGVTGVLLIALGVYGVLAYTVSQRTRDIAIRIALGGERRHVLLMVLRGGFKLLAVGIVVGLAAGMGTNRLLIDQLWNISPYDPATLLAAVAIIVTIGLLACWVPAVRAMRVEPNVALRHE